MTEVPDRKAAWRNAFADTSGAFFKTVVAPNVTLTGSVFATAVVGADAVWDMLRTTASIYGDLQFTESLDTSNRSYLEWEGHAVGHEIAGVTILVANEENRVAHVCMAPPRRGRDSSRSHSGVRTRGGWSLEHP